MDSELFVQAMYAYGRSKALELRAAAPELTDTEVIDQELFIPTWKEGVHTIGDPLQYEGQVYRVLQTHDSTGNSTWNPVDLPSLFSICHTKNPFKAKPWITPQGISGMYELGDCYIDDEGIVWRQIYNDNNVYDAATLPERWEEVDLNNFIENNNNNEIEEPEITESETPDEPENNENNQDGENEGSGEDGDEPIINNLPDEWKQPTGAHDAYDVGAIVSHNGKIWINTSPANIYEPGVFGWNEVVE